MSDTPTIKAPPVQVSDAAIAIELLERETGSREAALEAIAYDPSAVGAMKEAIDRRRGELQAQLDQVALEAWLDSPAGRRHTANETIKAKQERAELVGQARALLEADPQLADIDLSTISDDEALKYAGVVDDPKDKGYKLPEPTPEEAAAQQLRAKWFSFSRQQRETFAIENGISSEKFAELAEAAKHATHPYNW